MGQWRRQVAGRHMEADVTLKRECYLLRKKKKVPRLAEMKKQTDRQLPGSLLPLGLWSRKGGK